MGVLQIVPVGPKLEPVLTGVREFHVSKLVLITDKEHLDRAREVEKVLGPLKIKTEVHVVKGDVIMDVLRFVSTLLAEERGHYDDIYINVSSGTTMLNTAALCAAFVNGAKALGVEDDKAFPLPILRFSYYDLVSEGKLAVMRALSKAGGQVASLQDLSQLSGVDKSLLSYHIRGGRGQKGLEELGLVTIRRGNQGRLSIRLTAMGNMILQGRLADGAEGKAEAKPAKGTREAKAA